MDDFGKNILQTGASNEIKRTNYTLQIRFEEATISSIDYNWNDPLEDHSNLVVSAWTDIAEDLEDDVVSGTKLSN